jgi:hypothetical protein
MWHSVNSTISIVKIFRRVITVTDQENKVEEAPQTGPTQVGKKWFSHTTIIAALVVLAAVAMILIWANVR